MILTVAAIVLVGFVAMQGRKAAIGQLDPITFCPKSGPVAVHAILIDRTDPLSQIQLEALRREIFHRAQLVSKHEAFRVYEVGHGGVLLNPVVDVCNPGDGSDASSIDANPANLRRRYLKLFSAPIEKMLAGMSADEKMGQSPIMEAIQAIAVRDFGISGPAGANSLTIASDLLQYSAKFSLYREIPDSDDFARSPAGRSLKSDLNGVDISLLILFREKDARFQPDALGSFWVRWLTRQSATVSSVKQLPG